MPGAVGAHIRRSVLASVLLVLVGVLASAGIARAQNATIAVNAGSPGAAISNGVFGADLLAPDDGMGSASPSTGAFYPSLLSDLSSSAYVGSIRFPGGITAETYDWENAVGPQSGRTDNPVGPTSGPSESAVGSDEFGALLDQTGATGVITTNFGTGTPALAAAWVQYMTGANGSSAEADARAANGHPAPYDVPYWEVGNEESAAAYWRTGTNLVSEAPSGASCPTVSACAYVFGGYSTFGTATQGQPVVGGGGNAANRLQPSASTANGSGTADQSFSVQYPPIDTTPASGVVAPQVFVNGAVEPSSDYTLNTPDPGEITFTVALPPNASITATYTSGPHAGFNAFYSAMKAANPDIQVCSTATTQNFITVMGSTYPYDCMQDHPYVGPNDADDEEPIASYENDVMNAPATEASAAQTLENEMQTATGHSVPLVITEYGQLLQSTPDPATQPYYLNSLDEALVNASQLAQWITLGVPVADRQLLTGELPGASAVMDGLPGAAPFSVTGAITTTAGPTTVVQPTAEYVRLMSPLSGESLLGSSVAHNPALATTSGAVVGAISTVAGSGGGDIDIVAINRSATAAIPTTVNIQGFHGHGTAQVDVLDGASELSDNTAAAPNAVTVAAGTAPVSKGQVQLTLPAHSVSLIQLAGL